MSAERKSPINVSNVEKSVETVHAAVENLRQKAANYIAALKDGYDSDLREQWFKAAQSFKSMIKTLDPSLRNEAQQTYEQLVDEVDDATDDWRIKKANDIAANVASMKALDEKVHALDNREEKLAEKKERDRSRNRTEQSRYKKDKDKNSDHS